jgi:hypothetical protein
MSKYSSPSDQSSFRPDWSDRTNRVRPLRKLCSNTLPLRFFDCWSTAHRFVLLLTIGTADQMLFYYLIFLTHLASRAKGIKNACVKPHSFRIDVDTGVRKKKAPAKGVENISWKVSKGVRFFFLRVGASLVWAWHGRSGFLSRVLNALLKLILKTPYTIQAPRSTSPNCARQYGYVELSIVIQFQRINYCTIFVWCFRRIKRSRWSEPHQRPT